MWHFVSSFLDTSSFRCASKNGLYSYQNDRKIQIDISPPRSNEDWNEIASLIVETFDEPYIKDFEKPWWNLVEKRLTEIFTYRQYVSTARKMRGKKYNILVAKDSDTNHVVGMIELGMAVLKDNDSHHLNETKAIPMIGVLCVRQDRRRDGIGTALITKCEDIVSRIWNEEKAYVQIEPSNEAALGLFQSLGFSNHDPQQMKNATVARRRSYEERPHLVLVKSLESIERS